MRTFGHLHLSRHRIPVFGVLLFLFIAGRIDIAERYIERGNHRIVSRVEHRTDVESFPGESSPPLHPSIIDFNSAQESKTQSRCFR